MQPINKLKHMVYPDGTDYVERRSITIPAGFIPNVADIDAAVPVVTQTITLKPVCIPINELTIKGKAALDNNTVYVTDSLTAALNVEEAYEKLLKHLLYWNI